MEFKDYKEKQKYYADRSKEIRIFWESTGTLNVGTKEKPKYKGRTYNKSKEVKHDNDSK